MARNLPKVCPFLVTVDLKLKWPEIPRGPNYPALPYIILYCITRHNFSYTRSVTRDRNGIRRI